MKVRKNRETYLFRIMAIALPIIISNLISQLQMLIGLVVADETLRCLLWNSARNH